MSETNSQFDIPVVLIIFKRAEKSALIMSQISRVRPRKIYLIGDGPRNSFEAAEVQRCRQAVEDKITWPCEVIKNYADENRGVYNNIAGGAMWVFEREDKAIFLEDDNFPALSFFEYCRTLLHKYEEDTRILWICGTNYHGKSNPIDGSDYVFTKLMLPCGWASWRDKFTHFYDGHIAEYRKSCVKEKLRFSYKNINLFRHDTAGWDRIIYDLDHGELPNSWDYQMAFAIRNNSLYGIAPKFNQISNIGADIHSIHGGTSMTKVMTSRFCEVPLFEFEFPLKHPESIIVDPIFEAATEKKIILPLKNRIKGKLVSALKKILGLDPQKSISSIFRKRL